MSQLPNWCQKLGDFLDRRIGAALSWRLRWLERRVTEDMSLQELAILSHEAGLGVHVGLFPVGQIVLYMETRIVP